MRVTAPVTCRTLLVRALAVVTSCCAAACGSSETSQGGPADGFADGGGSGGSGGSGGAGGGGSGTGGIVCADTLSPESGRVEFAVSLTGTDVVNDLSGACDGSFVASGDSSNALTFERKDGTEISIPNATQWVARFDAAGSVSWAKGIVGGDTGGSATHSYLGIFPDGSVAMGGVFGTSATFAPGEGNETTLDGIPSSLEGYVSRYDAAGKLLWVRQIGPPGDSYVSALGVRTDGTSIVDISTGSPNGLTVGPGELDLELAENEGALVVMSADGRYVRASRYSGLVGLAMTLRTLADGSALVAGGASANMILAKGTPKEQRLSSGAFYARFTPELDLEWARVLDAPTDPYGMRFFPDGSIAVVGDFTFDLTLGTGQANETTLSSPDGSTEAFAARYDASGTLTWATQISGARAVHLHTLTTAPDGSVWVVGNYGSGVATGATDPLVFAPGTPEALTLETGGQTDFIARLSKEGKPVWAQSFQSDNVPTIAFAVAAPNSLMAAGQFQGTAHFGTGGPSLTSAGMSAFIARMGP
jgi:hypothetical protein